MHRSCLYGRARNTLPLTSCLLYGVCRLVINIPWEARARARARSNGRGEDLFGGGGGGGGGVRTPTPNYLTGRLPLPLIGGSISCSTSCSCVISHSLSLMHHPSRIPPDPARGAPAACPVHCRSTSSASTGPIPVQMQVPPRIYRTLFFHTTQSARPTPPRHPARPPPPGRPPRRSVRD
jgi:hypothetical protein